MAPCLEYTGMIRHWPGAVPALSRIPHRLSCGVAMEFPVRTDNPAKVETACLIVPVFQQGELLPAAAKLDDASERLIGRLIERGDFEAKPGNVQLEIGRASCRERGEGGVVGGVCEGT